MFVTPFGLMFAALAPALFDPAEEQAANVREVKRYKNGFIMDPLCFTKDHTVSRDCRQRATWSTASPTLPILELHDTSSMYCFVFAVTSTHQLFLRIRPEVCHDSSFIDEVSYAYQYKSSYICIEECTQCHVRMIHGREALWPCMIQYESIVDIHSKCSQYPAQH